MLRESILSTAKRFAERACRFCGRIENSNPPRPESTGYLPFESESGSIRSNEKAEDNPIHSLPRKGGLVRNPLRGSVGLFVLAVFFFSLPLCAHAKNPFKGVKDKAIQKFAGCYKKAEQLRKKCEKLEDKADAIQNKGFWIDTDPDEPRDRYINLFDKWQGSADKLFDKAERCHEEANLMLLKCRLDKKKFKPGCSEKEMDGELKEIAVKEAKEREELQDCIEKCDSDFKKDLKKGKGGIQEKWFKAQVSDHTKCAKGCRGRYESSPYGNDAKLMRMRVEAMEKCISLEK